MKVSFMDKACHDSGQSLFYYSPFLTVAAHGGVRGMFSGDAKNACEAENATSMCLLAAMKAGSLTFELKAVNDHEARGLLELLRLDYLGITRPDIESYDLIVAIKPKLLHEITTYLLRNDRVRKPQPSPS